IQMYIQHLFNLIHKQQQEIIQLQTSIAKLSTEMKEINKAPPVTVERLEYKFEQLKVERLEGTLNIGLNPADLNNIDDFSAPLRTATQNEKSTLNLSLLEKLEQYVEEQTKSLIEKSELQTGLKLEPSYSELI